MRLASAFGKIFLPLDFALLSMIFACAAASAFWIVDSLRAVLQLSVQSVSVSAGSVLLHRVRFRFRLQHADLGLRFRLCFTSRAF